MFTRTRTNCGRMLFHEKRIFPFFFQSVSYKTAHAVTQVDCQPVIDGSIMVVVLGQVKVCNISDFIQDLKCLKNS